MSLLLTSCPFMYSDFFINDRHVNKNTSSPNDLIPLNTFVEIDDYYWSSGSTAKIKVIEVVDASTLGDTGNKIAVKLHIDITNLENNMNEYYLGQFIIVMNNGIAKRSVSSEGITDNSIFDVHEIVFKNNASTYCYVFFNVDIENIKHLEYSEYGEIYHFAVK